MLGETIRAFLREPHFPVLATIGPDGVPQQTVVWYDLDGDEIVMNTAAGRVKHRNLRRDPRVSLCFEDGYRYLTLVGTCGLDDDQARAQEDIRRLAVRYHGEEHGEEMSRDLFRGERRVTVRMRVERVVADGF